MQGNAFDANTTWKSPWSVAPGLRERAGAGAQVVLGHDVGRGAELPGQLDRVAAAHLQPAALVQPAAQGNTCERLVAVTIRVIIA